MNPKESHKKLRKTELKRASFIFFVAVAMLTLRVFITAAEISYPIPELGNCISEQDCQAYCDQLEHVEVCLNFAEKNGLMPPEEIERARKFLPYLLKGETPGGCSSNSECEEYCNQEEHIEECIEFALKVGEISEEEAEMVRKTGGKGPGGCKGSVECNEYCNKEEHIMECIEFAYQHGLMDKEEYEMAKKTGGKGPGGCKGKEECEEYCKTHERECMQFAIEHGLVSGEEAEMMKRMVEGKVSKEEECMMECMKEKGIAPQSCKPGPEGEQGPKECKECAERCVKFYEGPCLTEEEWKKKEEECLARGENMEVIPVMGDAGEKGFGGEKECIVDLKCIERTEEDEEQGNNTPEQENQQSLEQGKSEEPEEKEAREETELQQKSIPQQEANSHHETELQQETEPSQESPQQEQQPTISAESILIDKISAKRRIDLKLIFPSLLSILCFYRV